jgi:hypothetical protein
MQLTPYFKGDSNLLYSAFRVAMGDLVGNMQPFQDTMEGWIICSIHR